MSNVILKAAIVLLAIAGFIEATHVSLDHKSLSFEILYNPDITNALLIIQYLFIIVGIFLIAKFIIDKIFNKK